MYGIEQGIKLLADSPLQVANLVDAGYFLRKTRSQTQRAIEDVVEAIGLARRLETDCLLIVTGDLGSFFRTRDQARELVIQALKEVAPVAESAEVKLAIEPIHERYAGYSILHSIPETLEVIDAVSSLNVGIFFDTDHLWGTPDLLEDIERAGERIVGVHVNDMPADPGPGLDRRLLGEGIIPLKEILLAIQATGYDGFYDVEIMSESVWNMDYSEVLDACKSTFDQIWS
jgi:sugar phosphate isomerase/epimerase